MKNKVDTAWLYFLAFNGSHQVTEEYHNFKLFEGGGQTLLLAELGSMLTEISLEYGDDGRLQRSVSSFHEIYYDEELKLFITELGALKYVYDVVLKANLGSGYHEITRTKKGFFRKGGELIGRVGHTIEPIDLTVAWADLPEDFRGRRGFVHLSPDRVGLDRFA